MKLKLLITSLLLAGPLTAWADDASDSVSISDFLLSRSPATAPSYRLDYTSASEVDLDDVDGKFSYQSLRLDAPLTAPLHFNRNNALLIGLTYNNTGLDTNSVLGDLDLHDLRLNLRWIYRDQGSKWSWMTVLSPGIVTDGSDIGSDDFSINGRVGFRYAKSDRFSWLGGAVFFVNSLETRVYPGIGFQWRPTDELEIDFTGIGFKASWQSSDDWIFYANSGPAGGYWNIEEGGESLNLKLQSYQIGVGLERRLAEKVWLGAYVGATIFNELELETASGNSLFEEDAETGFYAKLALRVIAW
ncbi:MAG: DUF6268 family outer membrane beta-barrel protein [Akkermansiaceae bacterium]